MRKVISLMHISLDGFAASTTGELNWISYSEDIFTSVIESLSNVDTSIYGRSTYEGMKSYWPTVPSNPNSTEHELHHAEWVENVNKIVFSTTLEKANWNNTRLISSNLSEEVNKLKNQDGRNMMIFGSPRLVHSFLEHNLVDEFLLTISPVVLGAGIPLFKNIKQKLQLKLLKSKQYDNGVLAVHYAKAE